MRAPRPTRPYYSYLRSDGRYALLLQDTVSLAAAWHAGWARFRPRKSLLQTWRRKAKGVAGELTSRGFALRGRVGRPAAMPTSLRGSGRCMDLLACLCLLAPYLAMSCSAWQAGVNGLPALLRVSWEAGTLPFHHLPPMNRERQLLKKSWRMTGSISHHQGCEDAPMMTRSLALACASQREQCIY